MSLAAVQSVEWCCLCTRWKRQGFCVEFIAFTLLRDITSGPGHETLELDWQERQVGAHNGKTDAGELAVRVDIAPDMAECCQSQAFALPWHHAGHHIGHGVAVLLSPSCHASQV